ncbi:MAG: Maf family protein [Oscillospiraceae bacterium]|jgi:septum formation protein|nr:Maf family protein [Oscillospiraceae bacterium]
MQIILASSSPNRREILEMLGLRFTVDPARSESSPAGLPPAETVIATAEGKAAEVAPRRGGAVIIAADTMVFLDGAAYGKPRDDGEAKVFLRRLSGRTHEVYTGVALAYGERRASFAERSEVRFRELTDAEIADYVATGEPRGRAGAYGIQGRGAWLIEGIVGDFYNVMGLPVCRLGTALREITEGAFNAFDT